MTASNDIGAFKLTHETLSMKIFFHFMNKPDAAFPFPACNKKGHAMVDLKSEWQQEVYDPVALKFNHCKSTKPIF